MIHVIYNETEIVAVLEPEDTGIVRTKPGRKAIIEEKETAKQILSGMGYDTSKIDEFENE